MYKAFTTLLNMSLTASVLVFAILLLRPFMKKGPQKYLCVLWALVAIRLILPISLASPLSAFNLICPSTENSLDRGRQIEYFHYTGHTEKPKVILNLPGRQAGFSTSEYSEKENSVASPHIFDIYLPVLMQLWLIGFGLMLSYAVWSFWKIKRQVAASIRSPIIYVENPSANCSTGMLFSHIFICDDIDTPFILGIIRPKIYLPSSLEAHHRSCVIMHEQAHIKRGDHIWKPLAFLLLSVYWFNPVLWLAYILLSRDIEAACDEKAIQMMSKSEKATYSQALLSCAMPQKLITVCPLAFGEGKLKERVRFVLYYKKPGFWLITSTLVICLVIGVCFLTNPNQESEAAAVSKKDDTFAEQNTDITDQETVEETSQHINLELDNLHIDADYEIPDVYKDLKMNRIEAHLPEIDYEKCIEAFGIDLTGTKKEVEKGFTSGNIGKFDVISYQDPDPNDSNYTSYVEFNPFGSYGVRAGLQFDKIISCVWDNKYMDTYNLDQFSTSTEWPFLSRDELFFRTKEALQEGLGITISDSYEGYALDYQTMKKEQEENPDLMGPVRDDWSEDDNTYFFRLYQEVDGLPISQIGYEYIENTRLAVWYDKDGYIAYDADNVYIINKTQEKQAIIPIDKAIDNLKKQYVPKTDSTIKINIDEIRLELMPVHIKDKEFEIRPVWSFYGMMEGYSFGYVEVLIDGITGELLYEDIP